MAFFRASVIGSSDSGDFLILGTLFLALQVCLSFLQTFLRVLDYVFTGNTRDELFVKIGIQLAVEVVIDAILGETLAVLAVQKVRLLTVF